ncbi:hypothetical protein DFH09DRAFT_1070653 [Mycena vulgaris]|nr:hypothetical protein DFH09DRAFT_1070653 [Mycena vulgaris]
MAQPQAAGDGTGFAWGGRDRQREGREIGHNHQQRHSGRPAAAECARVEVGKEVVDGGSRGAVCGRGGEGGVKRRARERAGREIKRRRWGLGALRPGTRIANVGGILTVSFGAATGGDTRPHGRRRTQQRGPRLQVVVHHLTLHVEEHRGRDGARVQVQHQRDDGALAIAWLRQGFEECRGQLGHNSNVIITSNLVESAALRQHHGGSSGATFWKGELEVSAKLLTKMKRMRKRGLTIVLADVPSSNARSALEAPEAAVQVRVHPRTVHALRPMNTEVLGVTRPIRPVHCEQPMSENVREITTRSWGELSGSDIQIYEAGRIRK